MVVTDARLTDSYHNRTNQPAQVLEEIYLACDNERHRLSAEIHDGVVQWMVGALYRINACRHNMSPLQPGDMADELNDIAMTLKQSVGELRRIIADLHPLPLEKLGLVPALRQALSALEEENITCSFDLSGELPTLSSREERAIFGIVQEALNNIRKHSAATRARLCLCFHDDAVSIEIFDNGQGFKHGNVIAHKRQIVRAGQACRTGANHCHLAAVLFDVGNALLHVALHFNISHKPLEVANARSLVFLSAVTFLLAGMRTDAADTGRKRQPFAYQGQRFFKLSISNKAHISTDVQVDRAVLHASTAADARKFIIILNKVIELMHNPLPRSFLG